MTSVRACLGDVLQFSVAADMLHVWPRMPRGLLRLEQLEFPAHIEE
jgi:hypothetical protein